MAQLWEWNLMTRQYLLYKKIASINQILILMFLLLTPCLKFPLFMRYTQKVSETEGFGLELTSRAPFYNLVHVAGNQIEQVLQDVVSKRNTWDGTAQQNTSLIYHSWLFFFDPSNQHIAVNILLLLSLFLLVLVTVKYNDVLVRRREISSTV